MVMTFELMTPNSVVVINNIWLINMWNMKNMRYIVFKIMSRNHSDIKAPVTLTFELVSPKLMGSSTTYDWSICGIWRLCDKWFSRLWAEAFLLFKVLVTLTFWPYNQLGSSASSDIVVYSFQENERKPSRQTDRPTLAN
jgi:hypothetical protein